MSHFFARVLIWGWFCGSVAALSAQEPDAVPPLKMTELSEFQAKEIELTPELIQQIEQGHRQLREDVSSVVGTLTGRRYQEQRLVVPSQNREEWPVTERARFYREGQSARWDSLDPKNTDPITLTETPREVSLLTPYGGWTLHNHPTSHSIGSPPIGSPPLGAIPELIEHKQPHKTLQPHLTYLLPHRLQALALGAGGLDINSGSATDELPIQQILKKPCQVYRGTYQDRADMVLLVGDISGAGSTGLMLLVMDPELHYGVIRTEAEFQALGQEIYDRQEIVPGQTAQGQIYPAEVAQMQNVITLSSKKEELSQQWIRWELLEGTPDPRVFSKASLKQVAHATVDRVMDPDGTVRSPAPPWSVRIQAFFATLWASPTFNLPDFWLHYLVATSLILGLPFWVGHLRKTKARHESPEVDT